MKIVQTSLDGVFYIEPTIYSDARGYFFESFNAEQFAHETGLEPHFVQDNEAKSRRGVVRGLHYQLPPYAQAKLVRVVSGVVWDVAVDIRRNSPTFGQYTAIELSGENKRQLYIPEGFAHGYAVLSDEAVFQYKCDNFYAPQSEGGISILDESLGIDWRIPMDKAILSDKDKKHPKLADAPEDFTY